MDITTIPFEESLIVEIGGQKIEIIPFRTPEHGNIKFGVNAPRSIKVHREEIYQAIRQKELEETSD